MASSDDLLWLIHQIRNTPLARDRLQLLARAYRTLRDLSRSDRLRVAREVGIEGAEHLVEQLAARGGASPARLLAELDRPGAADSSRIGDVIRGLIDPDQRSRTVSELAEEVVDWVADGASSLDSDQYGPEVAAEGSAVLDATSVAVGIDAAEEAREVRDENEQDEAEPEDLETLDGERAAADGERYALAGEDLDHELSSSPHVEETAVHVLPEAPRPQVEAVLETAADESAGTEAATETPADRESVGSSSLIARLRRLHRTMDKLVDSDLATLERRLEEFPPGWARRRALQAMLRASIPRRIQDALVLIDDLASVGDRMWALTTLATRRALDPKEREAVLAAAGSAALTRRLQLRLGIDRSGRGAEDRRGHLR